MQRIRLQEVPAPAPGVPTILETRPGGALVSRADVVYECGSCGAELLARTATERPRELVLRCWKCGSFNRTDGTWGVKERG